MQLETNTPRVEATINGFSVTVPQPYAEGQPLTAITAAILNQTFKENISNNTRAQLKAGYVATEGGEAQPYDDTSAQALIDKYVTEYEPGVRRGGGGEARVVDPIEREARKIATDKARELIKAQGGKVADFDVPTIAGQIFEKNKDFLLAEAKKIVKAREAAKAKGADAISLVDIDLSAKPSETSAEAAAA